VPAQRNGFGLAAPRAPFADFHGPRNIHACGRAKDSRLDSNDSITIFFFTDSIWGLRPTRLKLGPRVAGLTRV
jgi:hypothetical protein